MQQDFSPWKVCTASDRLCFVFSIHVHFTRCLLQIEDMRCQLNVTLLKAVLQIHLVVAVMDEFSCGKSVSNIMEVAVEELDLQEELRWKQNQVTALLAVFCASLQLVDTLHT